MDPSPTMDLSPTTWAVIIMAAIAAGGALLWWRSGQKY